MTPVHGFCDPRFAAVQDVFTANLEAGLDLGASVAVMLDGAFVVDLWGGLADASGTPWEQDTVVNVWSSTKTMMALCALVLADRGELDLAAPVASYWPDFKAAGKDGVLVRHLLGHTAGLPVWDEPMTVPDLYDWDKATGLLARQAPLWSPGTAAGYHAVTQGYLVGEVVRRVASCTLGTFFGDEIAGPLQADFHIGTPAFVDPRIAPVVPPPDYGELGGDDSLMDRIRTNPRINAEVALEEGWRRAEIPAGNGHGNARSMALVQHAVACGGGTVLSEEGCERVFDMQFAGIDRVFAAPMAYGMGYGLNPADRTCFWGGWGGSLVFNDLANRLTITYAPNLMVQDLLADPRAQALTQATYASLAA